MEKLELTGLWQMKTEDGQEYNGNIPGSVYSILLENNAMEDPYYRDNELDALKRMEQDYTFIKHFIIEDEWMNLDRLMLCFDGIDTIAQIYLNDQLIGDADNMHRQWRFDITKQVVTGENVLKVVILSPTKFIEEAYKDDPIGGSQHAMIGFPHLRKAHCMFGWDWGPRLPDGGIWRDVYISGEDQAIIEDVHIRQNHSAEAVSIKVDVVLEQLKSEGELLTEVILTKPDGSNEKIIANDWVVIQEPELWWPNGLGEQPLYQIEVRVYSLTHDYTTTKTLLDSKKKRVGLRTMTMSQEDDQWGRSFAHEVNGLQFFAMGANYIPEDNVLARVNRDRTKKLLEQCIAANFNVIRVWGGGYYPEDYFYDLCDEMGLVVWQDFMFACANYHLTESFEENIRHEFEYNIKRLRHHASLGLWCGNNEMEMFQAIDMWDGNETTRADYLRLYEGITPEMVATFDPDTFYWPASPSSFGGFDRPNDPDFGDVHYWEVWHGNKPFHDYRNYFFRYLSEFGFQSFPEMKTIESFTKPEDRNIFSRVMEMHQRNEGANGKIMNYLSQTYLYPTSFENLVYASQLLQAEAIRYGVEHFRRNRGRCMGTVIWQLNDIWPVASWASIDYFGRWKALHYYAKRFFAPIMVSCEEIGETTDREAVCMQPTTIELSTRLSVANETREAVTGVLRWQLRNNKAESILQGQMDLVIEPMSSLWVDKMDFSTYDFLSHYMSYEFVVGEEVVSSGTVLFTAPKHFEFLKPTIDYKIVDDTIEITSDVLAKNVYISSPECDMVLSDNFFDLNGETRIIQISEGKPESLVIKSVYDIR